MPKPTIAIIDSGLKVSGHYVQSIEGFTLLIDNLEVHLVDKKYDDELMHGTLCYHTIKEINPNVKFIICKIVNDSGKSNSLLLAVALEQLLLFDINIINISLATDGKNHLERLKRACDEHIKRGTIIVSSYANISSNMCLSSYPALFNNVLGVKGVYLCDDHCSYKVITDNLSVQASGDPQLFELEEDIDYRFFSGNSKATAMVSGILSTYITDYNTMEFNNLLKEFERRQSKNAKMYNEMDFIKYIQSLQGIIKVDREILNCVLETTVRINKFADVSKIEQGCLFSDININADSCIKIYMSACKSLNKHYSFHNLTYNDVSTAYRLASYISQI